jgi:hypothetical protein
MRWPSVSTDLWMPEINTFWSLLWNPLFPYSLALTLLAMFWVDRASRDGRNSDFWLAGLAAGVLALIHPYSQPVLLVWAGAVILARLRFKGLGGLARFLAALSPFLIYLVLVSKLHPIISRHSVAGQMTSPPLLAYALGFGLPLLLVVAGFAVDAIGMLRKHWPWLLWFCVAIGFSYFPCWFQRKLAFGSHVPLCVLAAISADRVLSRIPALAARRWTAFAAALLSLPLLFMTTVHYFADQRRTVRANNEGAYYLSEDLMNGFAFLRQHSKPDDVVFSTTATGRFLPAFSGNTVLWGHWAMSVDLQERQKWFMGLLDPASKWDDPKRGDQFWGTDIRYMFADGDLKLALEREPWVWSAMLGTADTVFTNRSVIVYRRRD